MKDRKEKRKIAKEIIKLECKCRQTTDQKLIEKYTTEMNDLIKHLSLEDILFLDEYIMKKQNLIK